MLNLKILMAIGAVITNLTFQQKCFGTESGEAQGSSSGYFKDLPSVAFQKTQRITCENGEEVTVSVTELPNKPIVRAQKDGSVIYIEDTRARLYSLEANTATGAVKRTKIFRFPILGTFYNLFKPNYFTLSKGEDGQVVPWAIGCVNYPDNPDYRTLSLFEMVNTNPVVIRNKDPWLPPWFQ
jgi:hypothetical protein